jgi:hypothetical protein
MLRPLQKQSNRLILRHFLLVAIVAKLGFVTQIVTANYAVGRKARDDKRWCSARASMSTWAVA